ncbi:MAG TPA: hypothetical protein VK016_04710 [Arenimonas sp.]|nr:hypothetical protein [Arenimonas sp.]
MKIALATAVAAFALDEDLAPLQAACAAIGLQAEPLAWDDPTVSWGRFDAVLLRSTWNYIECLPAFLAWCERIELTGRLWNPPEVLRWNTDKRYLADLAARGVPVVESHFLAPGDAPDGFPDLAEFVVKPRVGAGSRDARRFLRADRDAAVAHARSLLEAGRHVLVQPYLAEVDQHGETALMFFDGQFSHAIRKGPLLRRGELPTSALVKPERIRAREPSADELAVAARTLAALSFGPLPYARVDLLPSAGGPRLLELELTEPSLFLDHAPGSAERLASVLARRLA